MRTKIILELCANHNGDVNLAKQMIDEAKRLNVHGIKLQKRELSLMPDDIKNKEVSGKNYFGKTYLEHKEFLEFSIDQIKEIKEYTEDLGLVFVCTAFDLPSLEKLYAIGTKHIKIASQYFQNIKIFQVLRDLPVMKHISTGMHTLCEINTNFWLDVADVLYFCTSIYPAEMYHTYIKTMECINRKKAIGYSSHEIEGRAIKYVIFSGAEWIERHYTFDKKANGHDHKVSSDYKEMERIIEDIAEAESVKEIKDHLSTDEKNIKEKYEWGNKYVK